MKIKLVLADDFRLFREVLRAQLIAESDMEIVAEAGTGQEAIDIVAETNPDVLILDIAFPDMNGFEVARHIIARHPKLRIVALSGYADRVFVDDMMKSGAQAYVVKIAGAAGLVRAIRTVMAGKIYLSPELAVCFVNHNSVVSNKPPEKLLGLREKEVLTLVASGMQSSEIASKLGISLTTVKSHRRNIKQKLSIYSTAELTTYAIREGLQILAEYNENVVKLGVPYGKLVLY